jgi:hypothetical protein
MNNDLIRYLCSKIDEDLRTIEGQLALGHIKEFGDYKFVCGRYRGLLNVKDILITAAKQVENEDEH